ncbi:MAG: hypothetical protein KC416_11980, partial [Myxococcales bacterium]|nr:hypothetical protein [Myxococcales bacterium]
MAESFLPPSLPTNRRNVTIVVIATAIGISVALAWSMNASSKKTAVLNQPKVVSTKEPRPDTPAAQMVLDLGPEPIEELDRAITERSVIPKTKRARQRAIPKAPDSPKATTTPEEDQAALDREKARLARMAGGTGANLDLEGPEGGQGSVVERTPAQLMGVVT